MTINLPSNVKKPPYLTKYKSLSERAAEALTTSNPQPAEGALKKHRIGILFDDSSSMIGQPLIDAKDGVEEFLRVCDPGDTAVCIYPLNGPTLNLTDNMPALAILTRQLIESGSTPLVLRLRDMIYSYPLTRAVVFSDGQPNTFREEEYQSAISTKIPIDTVFIDAPKERDYIRKSAIAFLQKLATDTGGIFLRFKQGGSTFRDSFKYLSPTLRHLLSDKAFSAKIQGE